MITLKALKISMHIEQTNEKHNHDLVGYIIQKYPHKVIKGTILTRNSIKQWYENERSSYPDDRFVFLIGTVSLLGEIFGVASADEVTTNYDASHQNNKAN